METITMSAYGFTRTLPAMITSALWSGWKGDGGYVRRVDELLEINRVFDRLSVPVRIDFSYEVNVDDQPYTPYAVRVGTDADGKGGEKIEVYRTAREKWYAQHPEERPAPPKEYTDEEIEASEEEWRRMMGWDDGDNA